MKRRIARQLKKIARWPHLDAAILVVGIGVYVAQVLSTITKFSIWFDEAFSAYIIRFSLPDIAHYTALDVHPPLYYWVLKLWTEVFGASELGIRSLSLVFGVIAIIFGFLLVKKLYTRKAAWLSLLFLVVSPMLIRFGEEARMYTMVAAIALAATYVLTIAMESKKRLPWIVYGALVAAGMWTHYFAAMVWLAHWAWRAFAIEYKKRRFLQYLKRYFSKEWVGAHVLAVLLFVPWMPSMFHQLFDIQSGWFWIEPVGADTFTNYLTTVLFFKQHTELSPWLAALFIVIVVALIACAVSLYRQSNRLQRRNFLLIASIAIVPVILVFIASLPPLRSSFIERYLMPSVVGFSLFAGVVVAGLKAKSVTRIVITGIIVTGLIIGVVHAQSIGNFNKSSNVSSDARALVGGSISRSSGDEAIISSSPYLFYEAVFYETAWHPVYYLKSTVSPESSGSLAMLQGADSHNILDLSSFEKTHAKVWYIGAPGAAELIPPNASWKQLQSFRIDDAVTGKMRYQAIEFSTN